MNDDTNGSEEPIKKVKAKKKDKIPLLLELNKILGLEYGEVDWKRLKYDELVTTLAALKKDETVLRLMENVDDVGELAVDLLQKRVGSHEYPRVRTLIERIRSGPPSPD